MSEPKTAKQFNAPFKTFDVELPEVEKYLQEYTTARENEIAGKGGIYWNRSVIGIEVL